MCMWQRLLMLLRTLGESLKGLSRRIVAGRQPRMLFLLGAGFNIDANREAGSSHNGYSYPLVADVLEHCFGIDKTPEGKSIEDLFADALRRRDYKPMEALVDRLMGADYYIAQTLATSEKSNSYRRFFDGFDATQFLTFNYDSLPEIFLSQRGRWFPEDGYGVPVQTERAPLVKPLTNAKSSSLVVHLHGSACVFTIESQIIGNPVGGVAELTHLEEPLYAFDPDSITHCFPRYGRVVSITGRSRPDERVIAPVPDKSEDLKQAFIQRGYSVALPLVREAGILIAVGYSFNPYDHVSYCRILEALGTSKKRTLVIVSPQSGEVAKRISVEYPALKIKPIAKTFGQWAGDSFRS
jgi:hypothetical protein